MNAFDRDDLIRSALTPSAAVRPPVGLADDIHSALLDTPQRRPRWTARLGLRWLPSASPALMVLLLVALLTLAVVAILAIASRPTPSLPRDVINYHGNAAQTGVMPGPGPEGSPVVGWRHSLDGPLTALIMPLVAEGRVYLVDGRGGLRVLDESSGDQSWTVPGEGPTSGTPVIKNRLLIVGDDDGTVVAYDSATGTTRWHRELGLTTTASLAATDERVLVGSEDGTVHLLDVGSGAEVGVVATRGPAQRSPAIVDGVVYLAADGGHLTAFEAATGKVLWPSELGPGEVSSPAVADGALFTTVGIRDGTTPYDLVSVNTRDGTIRWRWTAPTINRLFVGAVSGSTVFALSEDGNVYAVDRSTGSGKVFFATQGSLESLATIVGEVLYVSSNDQHVYALDLATGRQLWAFKTEGLPSTPIVIDGRVIVGTDLGKVIALVGSGPGSSP